MANHLQPRRSIDMEKNKLNKPSFIHPQIRSIDSLGSNLPSSSSITLIDHSLPNNGLPNTYSPSADEFLISRPASLSYHLSDALNPQSNVSPFVHRCRFVDYTPGTITAIACSPSTWNPAPHFGLACSETSSNRGILAVGRGNGDIEIWIWLNHERPSLSTGKSKRSGTAPQAWSLYRTLPGHTPSTASTSSKSVPFQSTNSKVEHLLFAHQVVPTDKDGDDGSPDPEDLDQLLNARPRLIGSTGADQVLEWEWDGPRAGTIKRTLPMPPTVVIWSLAVSPAATKLAIGCDDGTVRLANIANDQLELIRKFDPCKTRLLSITWGILESWKSPKPIGTRHNFPAEPSDSSLFLVTGCSDSSLRKWSISTGRCVGRMTVEKMHGEHTLIWSVAVVGNTIVSGDSLGNVHFWDSRSCSRLQTIRAHRADVLCLVVSPEANCVFTSGVDQKTCQLTLNVQTVEREGTSQSRWLLATSRRLHSHDVRALEMSPPYNPLLRPHPNLSDQSAAQNARSTVPILISGGFDMSLVLCPAATPSQSLSHDLSRKVHNAAMNPISDSASVSFADSMQRKLSYVTQRNPVAQISRGAQLLVCRNSKRISIWRLPPAGSPSDPAAAANRVQPASITEAGGGEGSWRKVAEMDLKCRTNLVTSAISPNGRWLAISDLYEVKLFHLDPSDDGTLHPRRVKGFGAFDCLSAQDRVQGASCIQFSPDSTRLVLAATFSSHLVVIALGSDRRDSLRVLRVFGQHGTKVDAHQPDHRPLITPLSISDGNAAVQALDQDDPEPEVCHGEGRREVSVMAMTISPDGQWLASADSGATVHIFNMDSMKHHCPLPTPSLVLKALAFSPAMPSVVVLGFANNTLQMIDVETRKVPEWAQTLSVQPPDMLTQMRDSMIGIVFSPAGAEREEGSGGSSRTPAGSPVAWPDKPRRACAALIWGATWMCKMTIPGAVSLKGSATGRLKRRREGGPSENAAPPRAGPRFVVSHKYQPLLLVDYLGPDELVVVERPFFGIVAALPPAWQRTGVYGT